MTALLRRLWRLEDSMLRLDPWAGTDEVVAGLTTPELRLLIDRGNRVLRGQPTMPLKIRDSMDREHVRFIVTWMNEHCGGSILPTFRRGENWYDILDRLRPPALVRALWFIMAEHMGRGAPVSLAPSVAEVYLSDPDAVPANACDGCGYMLPTQSRLRPDGSYRHIGWYTGLCAVCGLDNHPERD